jgi:hypothetical protein
MTKQQKGGKMKKLLKKVENLMVAATFAEAGEHETAEEILKEEKRLEKRDATRPTQRPRLPGPYNVQIKVL